MVKMVVSSFPIKKRERYIWCVSNCTHCIIFDRRELLFWLCIYENWILCLQFYVSDDWKNFLKTSFLLDTFQTLSCHDTTCDPAPSCHVAGWVGTVGNKEYPWKPFLWEDEQYFNYGRDSKTHHWTHKPQISVFPTPLPNVQNAHSQSNATRHKGSVTGKSECRETVS